MADRSINLWSKNINNLKDKLENFQIGNNYDEDEKRLDEFDKKCKKLENEIENIEDLIEEEDNDDPNFKLLLSKFIEQKQELIILNNKLLHKRNELEYRNKKKDADNQGLIFDSIHKIIGDANEYLKYMNEELKYQGQ